LANGALARKQGASMTADVAAVPPDFDLRHVIDGAALLASTANAVMQLARPALICGSQSQSRWLIHTDTWAGSRAWRTTPDRSSRTASRSTASLSRAAKAATVLSAS
jgi:hypothetical protein